MKKLISSLSLILLLGLAAVSAQNSKSIKADQTAGSKEAALENQAANDVHVFYFHATRRCATCQAVEAVSKEAIKEYYGDKVNFESINREEEKDNPLVKKYKISGQTLLIIHGDKKVDLTNDAFLNARTNPDKFKSKLKSTIDSMM
ncbi:hypothetical protein MNBD_IGNAVI01-2643 [hydrothermal vent metagenome]|uniref:Thioredoxin domain-containing protein n=1 Tax=hydrothermal vent metagenome TaxID=652676 RepID=A0A3B1C344_9ZZZZ